MEEVRGRKPHSQRDHLPVDIDKEKLKKAFDISHFDINAVLRGIQLTLVAGMSHAFLSFIFLP